MNVVERFESDSPLVGMVHLPPLPGSPRFAGDRERLRGRALADAFALVEGGFDGLLVENFGDAPYYPEDVPKSTVAEMTAIVRELGIGVDCPYGVNVLRNDAEAALSVAAAGGGSFVRVNVHTGSRVTDQGILEGTAHETLRVRERLGTDVSILADVAVKHSAPVGERDIAAVAEETITRGLADGLVVSGPATGEPANADDLKTVLDRRDDVDASVPVFVGSGVTAENVSALLDIADGVIVGTALKKGGETTAPVDPDRVEAFVEAARSE
ncbi:BtpA/SgcQ family protein [Salinibaculum rarum]|uniref:BtpA/SgcQ family protein n=1 Tax=Salinibaculum rarum TaxID=3058903 RepID=UPI00265DF500|nr:BtpA/SgcQ family protein [Salinibaculum sp. KK48]